MSGYTIRIPGCGACKVFKVRWGQSVPMEDFYLHWLHLYVKHPAQVWRRLYWSNPDVLGWSEDRKNLVVGGRIVGLRQELRKLGVEL